MPITSSNQSDASPAPDWAWATYKPSDERPWSLPLAGHLLRRAGFGFTWKDLQRAHADGPQRTVDRLLNPEADVADFNRTHDEYESAAATGGSVDGLQAWWLRRMNETPQPLLEKMTLFWHDQFAVSAARIQNTGLMRDHLHLLRTHALDDFSKLIEAVMRDPAVLLAFGAEANRKASPSEPLARQLLERFTVGAGGFTEGDVREVARCLTGWFVLRNELRYFEREFDDGVKTVFGREGNFDGDEAMRIVVAQPATARHIVRRLYRWFICETDEPSDALVSPLAESFAADFDAGRLVATMLRSNLFFSAAAYRRKVKRPVEFALGIVKGLEANVPTLRLANDLAALGEDLCRPPTANGWAGGQDWINPATIIARSNLAVSLLGTNGPYAKKLDPTATANKHGHKDKASSGRFLMNLFIQNDLPEDIRAMIEKDGAATGKPAVFAGQLMHRIATLPEFQLA